jgi:selenocysteine lyase/cysteine desulfurase
MQRRDLLRASLALGALTTLPVHARAEGDSDEASAFDPGDWSSVRDQFTLSRDWNHMTMFLLASHPKPVAEAIERHRRGLDDNPTHYWHDHVREQRALVREAAVRYMGGDADYIALTDSTTMGLGLLYGSVHLEPEQEIVYTTHCHYSTQMALQHRAELTGAKVRAVPLYADPATTSVDEIVANTRRAIGEKTRVLAVTWVHSCTGVKLPIRAMADVVEEVNAERDPADRVLFCVDGVHGFGIEDVRVEDLGCDFFVAGTHKWIFGPRGTGVLWGRAEAWKHAAPIIPSFGMLTGAWMGRANAADAVPGDFMTPGGFHSFEHRWAVAEAFDFHLQLGKSRVQERIHSLNSRAKAALSEMAHVTLHTPIDPELSAGIICFEVDGLSPREVVDRFHERRVIASSSPYRVSYPRLAPSLLNDEAQVDEAVEVLRSMA